MIGRKQTRKKRNWLTDQASERARGSRRRRKAAVAEAGTSRSVLPLILSEEEEEGAPS